MSTSTLFFIDEVIRPLIAPAADPQRKSVFVVGEEDEEPKPLIEEPSIPTKTRGLEECVAILTNPEVRHCAVTSPKFSAVPPIRLQSLRLVCGLTT